MSNWQSAPLSLSLSFSYSLLRLREGPPFCVVAQHCRKADVATAFAQTIKRMYSQQQEQQQQQPHGKCAKKEKDQQSNGCARSLRCSAAASAVVVVVVVAVEVVVFTLIACCWLVRFVSFRSCFNGACRLRPAFGVFVVGARRRDVCFSAAPLSRLLRCSK